MNCGIHPDLKQVILVSWEGEWGVILRFDDPGIEVKRLGHSWKVLNRLEVSIIE